MGGTKALCHLKSSASTSHPQPENTFSQVFANLSFCQHGPSRINSIQIHYSQSYDDQLALSLRTKFLVGREVEGILENRGSGFFVKWNEELIDDIWVTKQCIDQLAMPEAELAGLRVKCTIEKMGPHHAH